MGGREHCLERREREREGEGEWRAREGEGRAVWGGVKKHERANDRNRGSAESGWRRMSRGRRRETVCVPPSLKHVPNWHRLQCTDVPPPRRLRRWALWWVRWPCRPSRGGHPGVRERTNKHTRTRTLTDAWTCVDKHVSSYIYSNTWTHANSDCLEGF